MESKLPPVQEEPRFEIKSSSGQIAGPFSLSDLQSMASQGRLGATTHVRMLGAQDWSAIEIIPGLPAGEGWSASGSVQFPWEAKNKEAKMGALDFVVPLRADPWAVIAGYLGLFSLILIAAPFSLAAGVMALKSLKAHPERTGKGRAWFAVIMGVLGTLALIWVGISLAGNR